MLKFDELPCLPEADRIMVLPAPPKSQTEGGLVIPEIAQRQAMEGTILAAGLKALDIMYDNGQEVGDTILHGQFAGVWEEWDHIIKAGKDKNCPHDGGWSYDPRLNGFRRHGHTCDLCGAQRLHEPILIMNIGDIVANVTKAERVRRGEMSVPRCETADGKTCHMIQRPYAATITSTLAKHLEGTTNGAS